MAETCVPRIKVPIAYNGLPECTQMSEEYLSHYAALLFKKTDIK
jgi:hypothetical protein